MNYEFDLSHEAAEMIKQLAAEKGMPEKDVVKEVIHQFLLNSSKITRFLVKSGPKTKAIKAGE